MGKKSRELMTGKTELERVEKARGFLNRAIRKTKSWFKSHPNTHIANNQRG